VFDLLPILRDRIDKLAGSLIGGEQQMLAIGRTIMSGPQLLLLDEPSTGLAPLLVLELMEAVKALNRQGKTVLLVEQNVAFALEISKRAYIIENGRIVMEGESASISNNERVKEAYLGG
jgi:branched-chain amino acid transport system ATP-binding protein